MYRVISTRGAVTATFLMLLALGLTAFLAHRHGSANTNLRADALPMRLGSWNGQDSDRLRVASQDILKLDSYVRRVYTDDRGRSVFVYMGYWQKQSGEHQAAKHSPLMCLPANGWKIARPEPLTLAAPAGDVTVSRLVADYKGASTLFYYWFFSGERVYRDESTSLFYIMRETLLRGRSDGGIVEITTSVGHGTPSESATAAGDETLRDFFAVFYPELQRMLDAAQRG